MNHHRQLLAFYLPQFHPIPENDRWWGNGFTEWTNVAKCAPAFPGHYQPHLPADLGFYDLRVPEVRSAQAELAQSYGVTGFCYYHYWFNGRRVLERPFNEVLASGEPDFPFCLCWANENWTRTWDGHNKDVLIQQAYSEQDDLDHIRALMPAFADHRYIRVDGKPVFTVYRATQLPSAQRTVDVWRNEAERLGIGELYLCRVESFDSEHHDPADIGFDAAIEFAPDWECLGPPLDRPLSERILARFAPGKNAATQKMLIDYNQLKQNMLAKPEVPYVRHRCVTPGWDNSARRDESMVLVNTTPEEYGNWLETVLRQSAGTRSERLVFINAWNEWAEGNHLEPCSRWKHRYLDATKRALSAATDKQSS